jgi:hypothetical protein
MRLITVVLLLFLVPIFGLGQHTISGKIVDELGLPIYLASVQIEETEDITYTDYEGNFTISSERKFHWKILIKSQGYKPETYFVLSGGKTGDIVIAYNDEMRELLGGN